jgi:hypothetical protein
MWKVCQCTYSGSDIDCDGGLHRLAVHRCGRCGCVKRRGGKHAECTGRLGGRQVPKSADVLIRSCRTQSSPGRWKERSAASRCCQASSGRTSPALQGSHITHGGRGRDVPRHDDAGQSGVVGRRLARLSRWEPRSHGKLAGCDNSTRRRAV